MERHFAVAVGARQAGDDTVAVQAFMAAALGYLEQGAHGAAFDAMMRALAVDPGALNVHLVMADVYLRRGWKELGVQRLLLIEHSLQLDADPGALRALAEVSGRHRGLDPRIDRLAATHA
jgi:Tfp pilus assembly protein PilF